jgi:CheY-like chemotaxis protein
MINLISNAIKYNRDHGRVEVTGEENGRMVRISVKDTGRGIPSNRQHELFQSFNRLGAENSDIEGTGIGLAICERLVHAMGGKIGFESVEGAGSTFWIELPKAKPLSMPTYEDDKTIEKIPSRKRSRILYIEDNSANITLMQNLVENFMDADLIVTRTGRSGLNEASFIRPDIIVSDIHLPDIDGREILKNLKKDQITANIPVIALTADASQAKEVGKIAFDHLLHKPYKVRDLVEIMNGILEKAA